MNPTATPLDCLSTAYVESLLEEYLRDPARVPEAWRGYFAQLADSLRGTGDEAGTGGSGGGRERVRFRPSFGPSSLFNPPLAPATLATSSTEAPRLSSPAGVRRAEELDAARLQDRVDQLIRAYRVRGHLVARIDPLGKPRPEQRELTLEFHRLAEADLDRQFSTTSIGGPATQTLRSIVKRLRNTYCQNIAAQFMHIDDLAVRDWLQHRMEDTENHIKLTRAEQVRILTRLTDAVIFEEFVRRKHVGAKTFSLEGAESLIPLLDLAIEKSGTQGIDRIVLGMAHRGRLNVLANILGKRPQEIFWEFKDSAPHLFRGGGDVKYHLGFNSEWQTAAGRSIHLSLCFNPSHLEFVNTVAMGRMRSKQDRAGDAQRERGMTLLIHGDAAFAGEGIIQETLNLSQLPGYSVGGTLHVIVNNQVGFTTLPAEARSTTYATDVAKMLQIPIFHVNGEDPQAVAQVVNLALDFRQRWKRDVVVDMYCYRRWGHNEGDEPGFTQPEMYRVIEERDTVRYHYLERLLLLGEVTLDEAERIADQRRQHLEKEFEAAHRDDFMPRLGGPTGLWQGYRGGAEPSDDDPNTGVPADQLSRLLEKLNVLPPDFQLHPKLRRMFDRRQDMARQEAPLDWSAAEALAWASLVTAGHRVRITGQDSERGTFSHRHSVLHDCRVGTRYCPLQQLAPDQAPFEVHNSPLSEAGVLGFEYGYSLDCPEGLIAWEAQFGDFWNVAQVIVDQFIASAEDKWRHLSGLVMLLPHGFEGQGPEHSSARVERFLQLCAEDNLQVVCPTTPAQVFHLLRRQVLRRWRKPLIMLTPKSLLRHPQVASPLVDLTRGRFQRVLRDTRPTTAGLTTRRVLLCTGKVYYDLAEQRERHQVQDVAIVRVEQLYPLPQIQLRQVMDEYPAGTPVYWVQEEPENMGAWRFLRCMFGDSLFQSYPLAGISRPASASPATGSHEAHKIEQQEILARALSGQ
ncbi:MAG: 2-oxoglutarate dehydrogenase E1 component [Pirellulales bacterium]